MRLGFLIDHSRCIGCHACTVACKEENQVPVGVYRTWVKYVETGEFPDVRRHFSVLRCNHCEAAPCVTICPTAALFVRDNGIVDFDGQECIGCKACMQACPYDALYIDPATQTAAKCNFCAHRVEVGLQPACEVVCPEQAILSGDLDDPNSKISQKNAREPVTVRKPEQGTRPKLTYIDIDENSVDPGAASRGGGYLFAEEPQPKPDPLIGSMSGGVSQTQAPDLAAQLLAEADRKARTTYDVGHERPWGARVSGYIFTKSIAAGAPLVATLSLATGWGPLDLTTRIAASILGLLFLTITTVLLVVDLKQPTRFLKIVLRPQWRSWVARGAFVLMGFGGLLTLTLGAQWLVPSLELGLAIATAPLAIFAAVYTAFLFAQAEGRDFWQNPALAIHLLVQAVLAGSASLAICGPFLGLEDGAVQLLRVVSIVALLLDLMVVWIGELAVRQGTRDAQRSAHWMTHGPGKTAYWGGVLIVGHLLPLVILALGASAGAAAAAGVLALLGLIVYEHLWILAGQSQPLS